MRVTREAGAAEVAVAAAGVQHHVGALGAGRREACLTVPPSFPFLLWAPTCCVWACRCSVVAVYDVEGDTVREIRQVGGAVFWGMLLCSLSWMRHHVCVCSSCACVRVRAAV